MDAWYVLIQLVGYPLNRHSIERGMFTHAIRDAANTFSEAIFLKQRTSSISSIEIFMAFRLENQTWLSKTVFELYS
jgi:hypothetical protein